MGMLTKLLEDDESAAEKIERLRSRRDELLDQRTAADERLEELESEIAEATAAGAMEEIADGRQERSDLRDEIEDLTAAKEVVEAKTDELAPEFLRERLEDLAEEYESAYDRAEDALDRVEEKLPEALDEILWYQKHQQTAVNAAGEMMEVLNRLREAGHEAERPVETDSTDKRLIDGRPRFVRYAVERLPGRSVFQGYLDHVEEVDGR